MARKIFRVYEESQKATETKEELRLESRAEGGPAAGAGEAPTVPLPPEGPAPTPASYFQSLPAPGNPQAPAQYPAQSGAWLGH